MSKVNAMVSAGFKLASNYIAYTRQLEIYRKSVTEAAKAYVDAHCDPDSDMGDCTDKYIELEKAVKKLRAWENLK